MILKPDFILIDNIVLMGFPSGTVVKNLTAMQETWIQYLGWEDPLEKEMATHSNTLVWEVAWTEEPGQDSPWSCKGSNRTERPMLSHHCQFS